MSIDHRAADLPARGRGRTRAPTGRSGLVALGCRAVRRRGWDLNPRWVAPQWFSRPSDSAALAPLLVAPAGAGHERVSVPTGPSGPAAREEASEQVGGGLGPDAHGHRAL